MMRIELGIIDQWSDGLTDRWTDGWRDRQMDGCTDMDVEELFCQVHQSQFVDRRLPKTDTEILFFSYLI